MKSTLLALVGLVAVGIATSFLLIPSERELALMQLRDADYEGARERYERLLRTSNRPVDVYAGLAELYLKFGEVDPAVSVLERYLRNNPRSVSGWERLAELYDYARRPLDRLSCLRRLILLDPSKARMHALAEALGALNRPEEQIHVLAQAAERFEPSASDLVQLANRQIAHGMYRQGAKTLERAWQAKPEAVPDDWAQQWPLALLQIGEDKRAITVAQDVLRHRPDRAMVIRLAHAFNFFQRPDLGLQLLDTYSPDVTKDVDIAQAVVDIQIDIKRYDQALEVLSKIKDSGRFNRELAVSYVSAALAARRPELALDIADNLDLANLPETQIYGLVDATFSLRGKRALRALKNGVSQERLAEQPLLCASFAVALGDSAEAQHCVSRIERKGVANLSEFERTILVDIYRRSGQMEKALGLLRDLALDPNSPASLLEDLVDLYLRVDRAEDGLTLFAELRSRHSGQKLDEAWARLSLAVGQPQPVIDWLESLRHDQLSEPFLLNLFYVSRGRSQSDVALMLAEWLYGLRRTDMNRRNLASALMGVGRSREAVQLVVPDLEDSDPSRRETALHLLVELRAWDEVMPSLEILAEQNPSKWLWVYASAARQAGQTKRALPLLARVAQQDALPAGDRRAALAALVDIGEPSAVLPYVHAAVVDGGLGGPWLETYEVILKKLKRHAELHAFWWSRGQDDRVPKQERRSHAYSLLATGEKFKAQEILRQLAQSGSPHSPDVLQLLYLWGPRPGDAALDWLAERARRARSAGDRAQWLTHLVSLGGSKRALTIIQTEDLKTDEVRAVHIAALHELRRHDAVAKLLRAVVPSEKDIGRLEKYGQIAQAYGDIAAARMVVRRIRQIDPSNLKVLQGQGFFEFKKGNFAESAELLQQYVSMRKNTTSTSWEVWFYLGKALERTGDRKKSKHYLEQALAILEATSVQTSAEKRALAELLNQTNRKRRAMALYEELLLQAPSDAGLRADVANLLLDLGETERAAVILSGED